MYELIFIYYYEIDSFFLKIIKILLYYRKAIKINMKYEKNNLKLLSFMGVKFQTPKNIITKHLLHVITMELKV